MADIKKIKIGSNTYNLRDDRIITLVDSGSTTAGTWVANTESPTQSLTAYTDGQIFLYKIAVAGGASTTTLNIDGLGAKTVYRVGTTKATTQYAVNQYILLVYVSETDGFSIINDADANSYAYLRQYQHGDNAAGTTGKYPLLARYNLTNKSGSYDTAYSRYHTKAYVDTSTGDLYSKGTKVSVEGHTHSYNNLTDKPVIDNTNQKVKTSSVTFGADDTVEIAAGSNVTVTGDATNKKITIAAKDTTYSNATTSAAGLMSATDKSNLDTIVESFTSDDGNTTIDTVKEVLKAFENAPEGTNIANTFAGKSNVGHTHEITTESVAPQGHTHTVTVKGTTGANSGTAISAATAIGVKSSSSASPGGHTHNYEKPTGVTLTANSSTATGRITYVQSISSTGASASSTAKVGSETHTHSYDKTTGIELTANAESDTGRVKYVESISGSKPTLGGTKTFVTGVSGGSGSLTSDTTATNGIKYVESISGGSGSLVAYNAATDGAITVENGNRIPVVTLVGHTAASVKSTANAAPHTHTHSVTVSGTTGANSGTAVAAVTGVGANGTATVLTGVKASSTATFLKTVTEGSGSLVAYDVGTEGSAVYPNEDATRIPVVTSLSKAGYTPAGSVTLTSGTAPSMNFNTGTNTDTPYISALTKGSYTPAGSVTLTAGTAPSMGSATTKYLHFSAGTTPKSGATPSHTSTATGSAGSGTASQNTGSTQPTFTGSEVASGAASSSTTSSAGANTSTVSNTGSSAIATYSGGILTITNTHTHTYYGPAAHTHTMAHTHSVIAAGTVGSHTHTYTKPAAHTHTYDKTTSVSLTDGTAPSLTANTTASGGIKYVEAQGTFAAGTTPKASASFSGTATTALVTGGTTKYMKFSAGTTPKSSASFTGTKSTAVVTGGTVNYLEHTHTATTEGTTASAVTAVAANGTATALTGVKATSTANVAPSGHTHSYGSSTALTTGNNSGSAVAAVTAINGGSISQTTYYLAHGHTGASSTPKYLHHTHTGASSSGTGTVSISGGEYTTTTKYLSADPTTTATASGTPSATTTVVTGVGGGTASATTKYLSAAPTTTTTATTANSGTNFNAATAVEITSTGSAAPSGHTHSYGSSTALTTTGNSGEAVAAVTDIEASTD